jgi:transcriptional regulator with XRE-family HTH domain
MKKDDMKKSEIKELDAIGQRIRKLRKTLNIQQKVMAKALGISPSYFNGIESSNYYAGAEILLKLSKIYNMSVEYLVTGKGEQFTNTKRSKPGPKPKPVEEEFPLKDIDTEEKLLQLMEESSYAKMSILIFATKLLDDQGDLIRKTKKDSHDKKD